MIGRRDYGKLGLGVTAVIKQVMDGKWSHASTEALMRRAVELAKEPVKKYFESNPGNGDFNNFGLTEMILEKLRTRRIEIKLPPDDEHPKEWAIHPRAIHNVPTGKPLDPKRAEDPEAFAKTGQWVRTVDLTHEEADRVRLSYAKRRKDSHEDEVTIEAIVEVLLRYPPKTHAREVWPEVVIEIERLIS